ncbi:MAG: copper homeostasis protein CutC [Propionibacteriaceae bacterium]|jgi:copper homeostasis protein|nr:copper homeostasis protein CutC [Propionibacteriaceae bacterium]
MIVREFCAENFTDVPQAVAAGVLRIELCDNLAVGGTTPSRGVIELTSQYAHDKAVKVFVMIRPRGGDFVYDETEVAIMVADIGTALAKGADGLVMGALTRDGEIDDRVMRSLMTAADGAEVTFHMAFDAIASDRQSAALDQLVDLGVTRVLTHGGLAGSDVMENLAHLRDTVDHARGRIRVIAGGGVTIDNYHEIIARTGVNEVHGTRIYRPAARR